MAKPWNQVKAKSFDLECAHQWEDDTSNGPHRCIKDTAHIHDITNDDHQCCCGATGETL